MWNNGDCGKGDDGGRENQWLKYFRTELKNAKDINLYYR